MTYRSSNPVPALAPTQMSSDISSALGRSSYLSNAGGINVNHDGRVVTLRGQVRSEEEARTAIGIAKLTPGVRAVKSELTFPAAPRPRKPQRPNSTCGVCFRQIPASLRLPTGVLALGVKPHGRG